MTGPSSNWESNPQILLVSAGSPLSSPFTISRGYRGPIRYQGAQSGASTPDPHGLLVCGVSLTSGQLINELFPDCLKVKLFALVLRHRGGDGIYEMRCPFVAEGPNTRFIVLPHWNNMSQAHMVSHLVTLY